MTPNNDIANHIPEDDLVLFGLQLLPEERMRAAMSHIQDCRQCRSEIAAIQGDLAAYSTTAEPQAPTPASRERFMRQVAREPRLTELPAFQLKPTEFELRESAREKERLAQLPSPDPQPAAVEERPKAVANHRQDPLQKRLKDLVENRNEEHPEDRGAGEREAVFSARQNRTLGSDSREEGEPVLPGRQSRTRSAGGADDEDENRFEERRRPRRAPWVLAWTGWAVAAGCSFVAGLQLHQRQQLQGTMATQQARLEDMQQQTAQAQEAQTALSTLTSANAMQVALRQTAAIKPLTAPKSAPPVVPPAALAAYLADKGALVFVATHMQQPAAGKTYELWLLPANGQNPIPAGTFKPDAQGGASVVMPHLPRGVPAKGFGVTIENDGGSQTPTMPIVMS